MLTKCKFYCVKQDLIAMQVTFTYQHSDTKTKRKRQAVISDSNCISGFACTLQNHQNLQWLNGDLGLEKKKKIKKYR